PGSVELELEITIGEKKITQAKTIEFQENNEHDLSIPLEIDPAAVKNASPTEAEFRLTVKSGEMIDVVRRSVPLRQRTYRVVRSAAGTAASDMTAIVNYPTGMPWENP